MSRTASSDLEQTIPSRSCGNRRCQVGGRANTRPTHLGQIALRELPGPVFLHGVAFCWSALPIPSLCGCSWLRLTAAKLLLLAQCDPINLCDRQMTCFPTLAEKRTIPPVVPPVMRKVGIRELTKLPT
jgi:hypothetical protein